MFWIAAPVVVTLLLLVYFFIQLLRKHPNYMGSYAFDSGRKWEVLGETVFVGFVSMIVIGLLGNGISSLFVKSHYESAGYWNIYSLADSGSAYGNFVLGTGTVKERPVFRYYGDKDNGYGLFWVYADDSTVIENDSVSPRINIYDSVSDNFWLKIGSGDRRYDIIVPTHSVKRAFNLDAQ